MNLCQLCVHPRVNEADAWLSDGDTHARVARRLGLNRQIIGRHVRNGHVRRLKPAQGEIPDSVFDLAERLWIGEQVAFLAQQDQSWTPKKLRACDAANASHPGCLGCERLEMTLPRLNLIVQEVLAVAPAVA